MNDSVREELHSSLTPTSGQLRNEPPAPITAARPTELAPPPKHITLERRPVDVSSPRPAVAAPAAKPVQTAPLPATKTSPTLVDFQAKNSTVPEWRLQMQNAVRQRLGTFTDESPGSAVPTPSRAPLTRGGAALKREPEQEPESMPELNDADPRLSAALRRIQDSRKTFLAPESKKPVARPAAAPKQFPFNVVGSAPTAHHQVGRADPRAVTAERPRPTMVTPLRMEKRLNTNKLPLIETLIPGSSEAAQAPDAVVEPKRVSSRLDVPEGHRIVINAEQQEDETPDFDEFDDQIEDLAPFSMRFNAGLFDLIIGVFATLVLLSPIALAGGSWMTTSGMVTFAGAWAIIMFLYTTASVGFFGKTLGMRLFSLELVDAEENEYPTIHQAAVSSSLYILSLLTGGLGFISVFFNEEKRAVHDLLSGTIIVREF